MSNGGSIFGAIAAGAEELGGGFRGYGRTQSLKPGAFERRSRASALTAITSGSKFNGDWLVENVPNATDLPHAIRIVSGWAEDEHRAVMGSMLNAGVSSGQLESTAAIARVEAAEYGVPWDEARSGEPAYLAEVGALIDIAEKNRAQSSVRVNSIMNRLATFSGSLEKVDFTDPRQVAVAQAQVDAYAQLGDGLSPSQKPLFDALLQGIKGRVQNKQTQAISGSLMNNFAQGRLADAQGNSIADAQDRDLLQVRAQLNTVTQHLQEGEELGLFDNRDILTEFLSDEQIEKLDQLRNWLNANPEGDPLDYLRRTGPQGAQGSLQGLADDADVKLLRDLGIEYPQMKKAHAHKQTSDKAYDTAQDWYNLVFGGDQVPVGLVLSTGAFSHLQRTAGGPATAQVGFSDLDRNDVIGPDGNPTTEFKLLLETGMAEMFHEDVYALRDIEKKVKSLVSDNVFSATEGENFLEGLYTLNGEAFMQRVADLEDEDDDAIGKIVISQIQGQDSPPAARAEMETHLAGVTGVGKLSTTLVDRFEGVPAGQRKELYEMYIAGGAAVDVSDAYESISLDRGQSTLGKNGLDLDMRNLKDASIQVFGSDYGAAWENWQATGTLAVSATEEIDLALSNDWLTLEYVDSIDARVSQEEDRLALFTSRMVEEDGTIKSGDILLHERLTAQGKAVTKARLNHFALSDILSRKARIGPVFRSLGRIFFEGGGVGKGAGVGDAASILADGLAETGEFGMPATGKIAWMGDFTAFVLQRQDGLEDRPGTLSLMFDRLIELTELNLPALLKPSSDDPKERTATQKAFEALLSTLVIQRNSRIEEIEHLRRTYKGEDLIQQIQNRYELDLSSGYLLESENLNTTVELEHMNSEDIASLVIANRLYLGTAAHGQTAATGTGKGAMTPGVWGFGKGTKIPGLGKANPATPTSTTTTKKPQGNVKIQYTPPTVPQSPTNLWGGPR